MYIRVGINMKKRIQFIIDELLKENFITVKEDDNVIILEENEEGGESRLKFKTKSSNTMTIESIDKNIRKCTFKDTSKFSMYKELIILLWIMWIYKIINGIFI